MGLTRLANSALSRILSSSKSRSEAQCNEEPLFPQFSQLPIELRLKIWRYAAYPRLVRLHLHEKNPALFVGEDRFEGYRPNWTPRAGTAASRFMNYPLFVPGPIERFPPLQRYSTPAISPRHLVVTLCSSSRPHCGCSSFPPKTKNSLSAPEVLLVCNESRYELLPLYQRYLEKEYDTWGNQVVHPISQFMRTNPVSKVPRVGITFAPAVDAIHLSVNIASASDVMEINRFAAILAKQIPLVQRVVISLHIYMPPYRFGPSRLQLWRTWGSTGWWVPVNHLVNMPALEEVAIVMKKSEKILPAEWRIRTKDQWIDELALVVDEWPAGWKGKMPSLRFVNSVEEL